MYALENKQRPNATSLHDMEQTEVRQTERKEWSAVVVLLCFAMRWY